MPRLQGLGRCLAPDLIGMGHSEKLDGSGPERYRLVEHRRYLGALLEALGVTQNVTLVVHDWGSALGFDWANRHREAVRGIAYLEAIVRPMTWAEWPEVIRPLFQALRSPAGEAPTPAPFWSARNGNSAAPGNARPRSPSKAAILSRRTRPPRSARRSLTGLPSSSTHNTKGGSSSSTLCSCKAATCSSQ